ncbi:MAG TPA: MBL fold metallo-hydrolase [Xanthobacteraceae bacterium]|jgi:glyoxylase-like metal-dependent hydrolase (beta-lactamase superfamily II)
MKSACLLLAALAAAASSVSARSQALDYARIEILTEQIAPNLYMLSGSAGLDPSHEDAAGGRIGVLAGPDGILMVDAQYAELGDKVLAAIRRVSAAPIRFLVNTHIHRDHTAGNAKFAKLGATIFAREELRAGMSGAARSLNGGPAPASDPAAIPVVTYGMGEPVRLHLNNEIVDLVPIRAAHTGGDTMIRFEHANAIMIGDYYRNFGYPFIDINNGGSLKGMLEALDFTMKVAGPDTRLVPGHGTLIKRADLIPYRDMIFAVQGKVQQLIAQGKSQQDVLAAHVTAPYDASVPGGLLPAGAGTSADRFVTEVYQELKGGK